MVLNHYSTERPTKQRGVNPARLRVPLNRRMVSSSPREFGGADPDGHIENICMISSLEVMPSISFEQAPMTLPLMAE